MSDPEPTAEFSADRNLLAALLALRLNFIDREKLRAASVAWMESRDQPLERSLAEQAGWDEDRRRLLAELVEDQWSRRGSEAVSSLLAVSRMDEALLQHLSQLADSQQDTRHRDSTPRQDETPPLPMSETSEAGPLPLEHARYRILRPHAKGGLGEVSLAFDQELRREVALKEIQPRFADLTSSRDRFLREAEITGGLEHPGIVPVYSLGRHPDGRPYYAMKFIRGTSLRRAIDQFHGRAAAARATSSDSGPAEGSLRTWTLRRLLRHLIDACNAIDYAHSRGVLHRDLKPENIMLGPHGETLVVDWGLARLIRSSEEGAEAFPSSPEASEEPPLELHRSSQDAATPAGSAVGTPAYMSPEQAAGRHDELTPAADVFSLGATLYALLTGQPPYASRGDDVLEKVRRGEFPRPRTLRPKISRSLESICLKAMALEPAERYASARALADDLDRWLADEPVIAHRDSPVERGGRWLRKHRSWALAGAAALLLVSLVSTAAALVINQQKQEVTRLARAESQARQTAEANEALAREVIYEFGDVASMLRYRHDVLRSAIAYYRRVIESNPGRTTASLVRKARDFNNLGTFLVALHELPAADEAFAESLSIYESLAPEDATPDLLSAWANAQANHGGLLHMRALPTQSNDAYSTAIRLQSEVVEFKPDVFEERLQLASYLLGREQAFAEMGSPLATNNSRETHRRISNLLTEQPDSRAAKMLLARSLLLQSDTSQGTMSREERESARKRIEQCVDLLRQLLLEDPGNAELRKDLALALARQAALTATAGELAQAKAQVDEATDLLANLRRAYPEIPRFDRHYALAMFSRGLVHQMDQDIEGAKSDYREAIEVQQSLVEQFQNSPQFHQELGKSWTNLAVVQRSQGNLAEALSSMRHAVQSMQRAWEVAPDPERIREALYQTYYGLAQLAIQAADHRRLVDVAERHAALAPDGARDVYDAARLMALAVPLVPRDGSLDEAERSEVTERYGRRAVELLGRAVELGLSDMSQLANESDLAAIRHREDFQRLVAPGAVSDGPDDTPSK